MYDYCFFNNKVLNYAKIIASKVHFGEYCFAQCPKLIYIIIPSDTNSSVEKYSFKKTKARIQYTDAQEEIINNSNLFLEIVEI